MKVKELMELLAKADPDADVGFGNLRLSGEFAEPVEEVYQFDPALQEGGPVVYLDPGEKRPDSVEVFYPDFSDHAKRDAWLDSKRVK